MRIDTKDNLYLHAHRFQPRFLVDDHHKPYKFICGPPPCDPANPDLGFPVVSFSRWWVHGDPDFAKDFHGRLHELLRNECSGQPNKQPRINGRDGLYGHRIRSEINCWDTPLIDVDAIEVSDHDPTCITALIEYKRPREAMRPFQAAVIQRWRQMGGTYLVEER